MFPSSLKLKVGSAAAAEVPELITASLGGHGQRDHIARDDSLKDLLSKVHLLCHAAQMPHKDTRLCRHLSIPVNQQNLNGERGERRVSDVQNADQKHNAQYGLRKTVVTM
eukprot:5345038-Amphidinium_carterae.1